MILNDLVGVSEITRVSYGQYLVIPSTCRSARFYSSAIYLLSFGPSTCLTVRRAAREHGQEEDSEIECEDSNL